MSKIMKKVVAVTIAMCIMANIITSCIIVTAKNDGTSYLYTETILTNFIKGNKVITQTSLVNLENMLPIEVTEYEHYNRNRFNMNIPENAEGIGKKLWVKSTAGLHQFSSPKKTNVKFLSRDGGFREIIFAKDGKIVNDQRDIGTYNYFPSTLFSDSSYNGVTLKFEGNDNSVKTMALELAQKMHYLYDVKPWLQWGNSKMDTTTQKERWTSLSQTYKNICLKWDERLYHELNNRW